ncbi:hypothetical protein K440DRAFT_609201 [Wilcoxina mikolae CBS 423.85]|nr:hypothetical protein K440DRAFT_609201 [Wilcoxina mikolae CBS 423.85]
MQPSTSVPKIGPSTSVPKIAPSIQVTLSGCFHWKLVFDYNTAGTITKNYRHKIIERFSWETFQRRTKEALQSKIETSGLSDGGSYVFRSATVDDKYDEVNHFLSTTAIKKVDFNREDVAEEEWKYEIGPNSKMSLYQRYFTGPGITLACDAHSSTMGPDENVEICVNLEARTFVSDIKVVCGDSLLQKPHDCVKHYCNEVPDIIRGTNNCYGNAAAKYVWLVPDYTLLVENACTGFDSLMDSDGTLEGASKAQGVRYGDLTGGEGPRRLFLIPLKDPRDTRKVVAACLYGRNSLPREGYYDQISDNLTYRWKMYLVSRTVAVDGL